MYFKNFPFKVSVIVVAIVIGIFMYGYFHESWQYIVNFPNANCIEGRSEIKAHKNIYPLSENSYQRLNDMTNSAVQRESIIENVQFFSYDVSKPVPDKMKKNKCILLKNSNPSYHLCLEMKGYFYDLFQDDGYVWEPDIYKFIKKFFEDNPNAMFVDLGMNIGIQSLHAASISPNIKVLGVEPLVESVMVIHKSIHLNNFQNRFTIILGAISDKRGPIGVVGDDSAGHRVDQDKINDLNDKNFLKATSLTFNDLTPLLKVKKALVKMDMEGMECLAFQNADKIFNEIDIPAIIMEIGLTRHQGDWCFEGMLKFLADRNYKAFYFDDYPNNEKLLNFTKWKEWDFGVNIYFLKFY